MPIPLTPLRPLLDVLVDHADPDVRDRILLESVLSLGAATSAALWRSPSEAEGWSIILERGPADALPTEAQVRDVLAGHQERELPGRGLVLCAPGGGVALALGEVENLDERLDAVEALLLVWEAVELASPRQGVETRPALRPAAEPSEPGAESAEAGDAELFAHDLRNFLTGIQGSLEILGDPTAAPLEEESLRRTIERECRRAADLLADALCPQHTARSEVVLDRIIADTCASERSIARALGVDLEVALELDDTLTCTIQGLDLERILRNLLVNAREALREQGGGTVCVTWGPTADGAPCLRVTDDGPGLPAPILDAISRGAPAGPGRGLGLESVHRIASSVGGRLRARNLPTGGADLTVELPGV